MKQIRLILCPRGLARYLLLAGLVTFSLSPVSLAQSKSAAAREQFKKAEKQRTALNGKPQKERTAGEYQKLIASFRRVYLLSPRAAETPAALLAVAELHQEMGRQFDPQHFQSAIDSYQFLLHEYPANRYRADALFTIGSIQQDDLGQLDDAEKTFEEFLKLHPRSEKAGDARQALTEIAAAREQEKKAKSSRELAARRERKREEDSRTPQVTSIRFWNADNYTRIVIDVEDGVKYQAARIADPDRIYFDIHKAKLSSTLAGKTFDVQNGFLKTIRVAQNQAGVVRVVLEVEKVKDYSAFFLPDPYRLVVDIYGETVTTAKAMPPAEAPKPAAKGEKAEAKPARSDAKTESKPEKSEKAERARAEPLEEKGSPSKSKSQTKGATREPAKDVAAIASPTLPQPTRKGQLPLNRVLGLKVGRIVIDAGHGGHDTGTVGPTGLMEKDLCLDLALRLGKMIEDRLPGTEITYTREDDTFVPLENRTAIANQAQADMFISIHANSSRDKSARGVETYYLNFSASGDDMEVAARENALSQASIHELQDLIKKIAKNEKVEESRELATEIQTSLSSRLKKFAKNAKNRGVKRAPFVVLIGANMPSVLAEVSFLSNPSDESLLKKNDHRNRVVEGIFHGVQSYLKGQGSLSFNQQQRSAFSSGR